MTTPPPRAGGHPPTAHVGRVAGEDVSRDGSVGLGDYHPGRKKSARPGRSSARGGVSGSGERRREENFNEEPTAPGEKGGRGDLPPRERRRPRGGGRGAGAHSARTEKPTVRQAHDASGGARGNGRPSTGRGSRAGVVSRGPTLPMHTTARPVAAVSIIRQQVVPYSVSPVASTSGLWRGREWTVPLALACLSNMRGGDRSTPIPVVVGSSQQGS